jgi:hypothetical protein
VVILVCGLTDRAHIAQFDRALTGSCRHELRAKIATQGEMPSRGDVRSMPENPGVPENLLVEIARRLAEKLFDPPLI